MASKSRERDGAPPAIAVPLALAEGLLEFEEVAEDCRPPLEPAIQALEVLDR